MPTVTLNATIRLPSRNQLMAAGTTLDVDDETAARLNELGLIEPNTVDTNEHDNQALEVDSDEPSATAPKPQRPPRTSTTDRWRQYAHAHFDFDTKGMTKQEIIAACNRCEQQVD